MERQERRNAAADCATVLNSDLFSADHVVSDGENGVRQILTWVLPGRKTPSYLPTYLAWGSAGLKHISQA